MPTIRDVAQHAGVAPITVSRVVNQDGYVSDETRARVEAAIAELGYVPNRLARGLRSKRTNTLGLVLTDIANPFWTTVARGVEDAAEAEGFSVILCNTDESEHKQEAYLHVLLQKQVDGFVLAPARSNAAPVTLIQQQDVPVVVIDRRVPVDVDTVRCDSEGGAYQLTRHLLDLGHRHIAILSSSAFVSTAEDRVAGYRRALQEADLPVDDAYIFHREFTQAAGDAMARQAMALTPCPTALFAVNNFIAIGAYKAVREMGLHVPDDASVVAFDDLPLALVIEPFLTVASQPAYAMGRRATELLLQRLSNDATEPCQHIVLPTTLIVRQSSGLPKSE
ncbi:MAG: LacI family DNA-binding transcriptional regulator [Anaerolineae bacterium]|nr:LacI family DNA-binding transcriptional regulator [Anaerolineae bacterium]